MVGKEVLLVAVLVLLALRIPTSSRRRNDRRSSGAASHNVAIIGAPPDAVPLAAPKIQDDDLPSEDGPRPGPAQKSELGRPE